MKSILVVFSRPNEEDQSALQRWELATTTLQNKARLTKNTELIAEGCLYIHGENGLQALAAAISAAEVGRVSYRVLFIEGATEWVRTFPNQ